MSSASDFADSLAEFNQQKAEVLTGAFGRIAGETDPTAPNLQLGELSFRAAFGHVREGVDFRSHGVSVICDAVIYLPTALGLRVDENSRFIYLPTGEKFDVLPDQNPGLVHEATRRIHLRRAEA